MPIDFISELTQKRKIQIKPFFDQMPSSPRYQPNDPKLFSYVGSRVYHLDLSPGQTNAMGQPIDASVKLGPGTNPALSFNWLPYVAGSITYMLVGGNLPIFTGKMSGCWLAAFQIRGQKCFAHIGTDSNSRANTEDVKNAWKIALHSGQIAQPFRAFNPVNHIVSGAADFGAINSSGELYGISFDGEPDNVFVVKNVRHVPAPSSAPQFT